MSHVISCPQCKRQIPLDPKAAKVVAGGTQSVQCASCKHTWMPKSNEVRTVDAPKPPPRVPQDKVVQNPIRTHCPECGLTNEILDPIAKREILSGNAIRCKECGHKWVPLPAANDTHSKSSSPSTASTSSFGLLPWISKEPAPFTPSLWDGRERGLRFYVAFARIAAPIALFIGLLGGAVSAGYFVHYGNEAAKYREEQDESIRYADTMSKFRGGEADYSMSRSYGNLVRLAKESREASLKGIFWNPLVGLSISISFSVAGDLILLALRAVRALERNAASNSNATVSRPSSEK